MFRPLTDVQIHLRKHVLSFLGHRKIVITKDETKNLGGWQDPKHPESYVFIEAAGYEIFLYEDGQSQIMKDKRNLINLEMEDFDSLQELEACFFAKLTEIFGTFSMGS